MKHFCSTVAALGVILLSFVCTAPAHAEKTSTAGQACVSSAEWREVKRLVNGDHGYINKPRVEGIFRTRGHVASFRREGPQFRSQIKTYKRCGVQGQRYRIEYYSTRDCVGCHWSPWHVLDLNPPPKQ